MLAPFEAGGDHVRSTRLSPGTAVTVGAAGTEAAAATSTLLDVVMTPAKPVPRLASLLVLPPNSTTYPLICPV
jgi:hypothetical protein